MNNNKNKNTLSEKIKKLSSLLFSVQDECNNNPFNVKNAEKKLSKVYFNKNDLYLANDLPWPLAKLFLSYKRHQNKSNLFEKFDFVEHFFLILLFFNISIFLWAFGSNYWYFLVQKERILKSMKSPDSIWFGDLENLSKTLSKIVREKLWNKNWEDFLKNLFKVSNIGFVKDISNIKIYKNIEEFSCIRNEIKWHWWRISNETYWEILPKIEKILYNVLNLLEYFSLISIILWTNFKKSSDSFFWEVTFIKWYSMPYLVEDYELPEILDENVIYYIDKNINTPIPLSWLIKSIVWKDEGDISFYFYNRIEWNKVRYVNYDLLDWDRYYPKKDNNNLVLFW